MADEDGENISYVAEIEGSLNGETIPDLTETEAGQSITYTVSARQDYILTGVKYASGSDGLKELEKTAYTLSEDGKTLTYSTAIIGPISFLGLIVPHIARLLVGSNHKVLVPYSILLGAFTLLLADTLGRTIAAPYEISAAIIMSVVGGPFFILLLRRSKQSYGQ